MKKLLPLALITIVTFFNLHPFGSNTSGLFAQYQFEAVVGGSDIDAAYCIIQTSDGGFAISGWTKSFGQGSEDVYVAKFGSDASLEWTKIIGGPNYDVGLSIVQTNDGGYAIAGTSNSFGAGGRDVYLVKLDNNGDLEWTRTVGGIFEDYGHSVVQTSDGGYAIGGYTESFGEGGWDAYIVKMDSAGTLQWTKTIGGPDYDQARAIIQTSDNGYMLAGHTKSFGVGIYNAYAVKLDSTGSLQWTATVGGTVSDQARSVVQTSDGGYALAGLTNSFGEGGTDAYVIKLDNSGNLLWSKSIGGIADEEGYSILQTSDGGYAIGGYSGSFMTVTRDFYVVKTDSDGAIQWTSTLGGDFDNSGNSLISTSDGGYAMAGATFSYGAGESDMYVVKLDGGGESCETNGSIGVADTGGTAGTGGLAGSGGVVGFGGILASDSGATEVVCIHVLSSDLLNTDKNSIIILPNPAIDNFRLLGDFDVPAALNLYDISGRQVYSQTITGKGQRIDVTSLSEGMYVWKLGTAMGKIVVVQ